MNIFHSVPCLSEYSVGLEAKDIFRKWFKGADKRIFGQHIQKFLNINRDSFEFLGIEPIINGVENNITLSFRTSSYVGAIPLRSPINGKSMGDFIVTPRYANKNYIELLDYLGHSIIPQFQNKLPLVSDNNYKPPLYLEALNFIRLLERLSKKHWKKFSNFETSSTKIRGNVNWNKYASSSVNPEKVNQYPTRINNLNEFHLEYFNLKYVYNICKKAINTSTTPIKIKLSIKNCLNYLDKKLYFHEPKETSILKIKSNDNSLIKELKTIGNLILHNNFKEYTGWRIDFNEVFERYIQKLVLEVSREIGFSFTANPRMPSSGMHLLPWSLKYLEPDMAIHNRERTYFVDAKYKSHLLNRNSKSSFLKEEFRKDLHQILAYSSFSTDTSRISILCYPSDEFSIQKNVFKNPFNSSENQVQLWGIPLNITKLNTTKETIIKNSYLQSI